MTPKGDDGRGWEEVGPSLAQQQIASKNGDSIACFEIWTAIKLDTEPVFLPGPRRRRWRRGMGN